jgi:hypothetical protein
MYDRLTILNLLNKFSNDHENVSWELKNCYSDGMGTTINQIKIFTHSNKRTIGVFSYQVETGRVLFCWYKNLRRTKKENIMDMLLDMINYSKGETEIL